MSIISSSINLSIFSYSISCKIYYGPSNKTKSSNVIPQNSFSSPIYSTWWDPSSQCSLLSILVFKFEIETSTSLGMMELYWYKILIIISKSLVTYVFSKVVMTSRTTTSKLILYNIFTIVNGNTFTLVPKPCLTWINPRSTSTIAPIFIKKSNPSSMS